MDRDQDGIPDAEQITTEELEAIDRHIGDSLIAALADPAMRAEVGRQADADFDPGTLEYTARLTVYVVRDRKTGKRYQVNYTKLVTDKKIELREGHSIEGGVMGGRAQLYSQAAIARMGSFGPFFAAFLAAGGTAPAILANAAIALLRSRVKNPTANAVIDALLGRGKALVVLLVALALAGASFAQGPAAALVLDHDMLVSLARTREPELRIGYTPERVELRTRRSALVGWVDVLLTAKFERCNGHVQLVAQTLRAGPLEQRGKRLEEARAGLRRLVNVRTAATRVEIYRAGELVYSQVLDQEVVP